jgi:DNA mismatch repair ATPase MutS
VAKLAGLPAETIAAAEGILATLNAEGGFLPTARPAVPQALLFAPEELVLKELHGLRIEGMTPLEALNRIARWKQELGESGDA